MGKVANMCTFHAIVVMARVIVSYLLCPKHVIDHDQELLNNKMKSIEKNLSYKDDIDHTHIDITHVDVADFFIDLKEKLIS